MNEIVNKFQKHLIVNEYSASTIENYTGRISRFLKFTKGNNITEEIIIDFLLEVRKTVSSKTLNCYKDSISIFLRFLKKDIPVPKRAKTFQKLPEYFTLKFFEKSIIPMIDLISRKPIRDKILLYFVFFTGLRKNELPRLKRKNFNLEERIVKVIIPKTKEERIVFYTKRVKDLLEAYFSLEVEDKNALNICPSTLGTLLKNLNPYFKEIHLHPHKFRHSFAAHFLMQGGDISDLKEFLGHKSIQSTMRYAGLKTDDRKKKYDKFMK